MIKYTYRNKKKNVREKCILRTHPRHEQRKSVKASLRMVYFEIRVGRNYKTLVLVCHTHRERERERENYITAGSIKDVLNARNISTLDWPARSLDLNVIENVRGELGGTIYEGGKQCNDVQELKEAISCAWKSLDRHYVKENYSNQTIKVYKFYKTKEDQPTINIKKKIRKISFNYEAYFFSFVSYHFVQMKLH